ncbi:MAG: Fic family protein [Anaerolinea sp.]|nr:Fic family protein [Anaerolinea sp.]
MVVIRHQHTQLRRPKWPIRQPITAERPFTHHLHAEIWDGERPFSRCGSLGIVKNGQSAWTSTLSNRRKIGYNQAMNPFNPHYAISPHLLNLIKQIALLVHDLNQQAVPDVVFLEMQAVARAMSTYASTSIEGNPLPLTEVKRLLKQQPAQMRPSEQEVVNYNRVLSQLNQQPDVPFTAVLIQQIQAGVMADLLPPHQLGQWRREAVVVYDPRSQEIVYLPPNYEDVPMLMAALVAFVQENGERLDPLLLAGLFHKQMVVIHPFMDGNGRATRLATKLLLAGLGLNTFNLFSFENYYNQNVTRYFQHVGLFGDYNELALRLDFTPWLVYFAEGILDELRRVQKQIQQTQLSPATRLQPYHQQVLAYIDEHGFITDKDYGRLTDRAKATRTSDFNKLIDLGLITRQGKGRATHYRRLPDRAET